MLNSRRFILLAAGLAVAPGSRVALAQTPYPSRPVRLIVPNAGGGTADATARLLAQLLSTRFGQQFIIENRAGAGGHPAMEAAVAAPPDGHALSVMTIAPATSAALYDNPRFAAIRAQLKPVAAVSRAPLTMLVHPSVAAKTLPDFIALARQSGTRLNIGTTGATSPPALAGVLLGMMAGFELTQVPYRSGAQALTDLIGGDVQVMFSNLPAAQYVQAGKLRALAVTSKTRTEQLPDVPAIAEVVPGFEASTWVGLAAHVDTPRDIVERLNRAVGESLAEPEMKAALAKFEAVPFAVSPRDFDAFLAEDGEKWARVIRAANIKGE